MITIGEIEVQDITIGTLQVQEITIGDLVIWSACEKTNHFNGWMKVS